MAPFLSKGTGVVLESTTYSGTTDEDLLAELEQGSFERAMVSGDGDTGRCLICFLAGSCSGVGCCF